MNLAQTITEAQRLHQEAIRLEREALTALVNKTEIIKKNNKSLVIGCNDKTFKCAQNARGFWKASLNGKVWISSCSSLRELRIFIAKHA